MAIQIIFILLLPVVIGYLIGATRFFNQRTFDVLTRLHYNIRHFNENILKHLPTLIRNEIGIRRDIVESQKYYEKDYANDVRKIRIANGEAARESLARRLQHTDHTRPGQPTQRPPLWIRKIIAQVVR